MLRLKSMVLAATLAGLLLSACVQPTPTPTPAATGPGIVGTGYPALAATDSQPTGYPPQPAAPTADSGYPAGGEQAQPSPEPSVAASATPAATPTTIGQAEAEPTSAAQATATPGLVVIAYRDFEILPAQTTIKAGTEVTFFIENGTHQPYADSAAPFIFEAPPNLSTGSLWMHTFAEPGTLTLLCGYHADMSATLVIEP
jgi:plastocyanin